MQMTTTPPESTQLPETCRCCTRMQVRLFRGHVTRLTCGHGLHLQAPCNDFDALPDGREAVAVTQGA
jgi:hypothetical protein